MLIKFMYAVIPVNKSFFCIIYTNDGNDFFLNLIKCYIKHRCFILAHPIDNYKMYK